MDNNLQGLLVALVGGGLLIGVAQYMSARTGRERKFDEKVAARLAHLEARNERLERENDRLRLELIRQGKDPDEVLKGLLP